MLNDDLIESLYKYDPPYSLIQTPILEIIFQNLGIHELRSVRLASRLFYALSIWQYRLRIPDSQRLDSLLYKHLRLQLPLGILTWQYRGNDRLFNMRYAELLMHEVAHFRPNHEMMLSSIDIYIKWGSRIDALEVMLDRIMTYSPNSQDVAVAEKLVSLGARCDLSYKSVILYCVANRVISEESGLALADNLTFTNSDIVPGFLEQYSTEFLQLLIRNGCCEDEKIYMNGKDISISDVIQSRE